MRGFSVKEFIELKEDFRVVSPKTLKTSKGIRHCKYPKCATILNTYNLGVYCHLHQHKITMEREAILLDKSGLDFMQIFENAIKG